MKLIIATILASALSLSVCLADAKDDLKNAAAKLKAAPNYSWTTTTEIEGSNMEPIPVTGKAVKDGCALICQERDGNLTMAVRKGTQAIVKTDEGWQTAEELRAAAQGGGGGRGTWMRGALLRARMPAEEAALIVDHSVQLKAADGVISGDLTEAGAKELLSFGRGGRQGAQMPEAKNAKGSVKVWLKDGQIAKMQVRVSGTFTGRNGEDRDMTRITTCEVKDIGSTKVDVPADAMKKLGV